MKSIQEIRDILEAGTIDAKEGRRLPVVLYNSYAPNDPINKLINESPQLISDLCDRVEVAKKALESYSHGELSFNGGRIGWYGNINEWIKLGAKFELDDPGKIARQALEKIS